MAIFGLFRCFGPFGPFFACFGLPVEGGFTSTPRAGALYRVFWGSEGLGPGRAGEAPEGPKTGKIPDFGDPGPGAPEGSGLPLPGTGPRREGLM